MYLSGLSGTAAEIAMRATYGGADFDNQSWLPIISALFARQQSGDAMRPVNGWILDSYQPLTGTQLTRIASDQTDVPDGYRRWDTLTVNSNTGQVIQEWQQINPNKGDNWLAYLTPFLALTGIGLALGPWVGATDAADAANVAEATGTATDEFANETAKLVQQQALAQSGVDLLPTTLPELSTTLPDAAINFPSLSTIKSAAGLVQTVAKGAALVKSVQARGASAMTGSVPVTGAMPGFDFTATRPVAISQNTNDTENMMLFGIAALCAVVVLIRK